MRLQRSLEMQVPAPIAVGVCCLAATLKDTEFVAGRLLCGLGSAPELGGGGEMKGSLINGSLVNGSAVSRSGF